MNLVTLSNRLGYVATFVTGKTLADIGSDHAYLPCFVVENGLVEKAIAGEVVLGPYNAAMRQVSARQLQEKIAVRLGDGLDVIAYGEADSITICGMGGSLIVQILEAGKTKLSGHERLILQPNVGAELIRAWLLSNGKRLVAETILEEDGKIYEILVAESGSCEALTDVEERFGPYLLKEKNEAFIKKWMLELTHMRVVEAQLRGAKVTAQVQQKQTEVGQVIGQIVAVLADEENGSLGR